MPELTSRTFRVSFDVTVSLNEIDDALVAKTKEGWNNPALATDPDVEEQITRDRHLLAALVQRPGALRWEALRRVAWELNFTRRADLILRDIGLTDDNDLALVEQLQDALPPDAATYLHDAASEDIFYDNTSFFQAAFSTEIGPVTITDADVSAAASDDADVVE